MMKILLLAIIIILLYPVWVAHKQCLGEHEVIKKSPAKWGAQYKDISYVTRDGFFLKGWWIPAKSDKAVLLLHGKSGNRNGFHTGIFELGKWYHDHGFNVMMPDLRAHGESGGKYVTFGLKESEDMLGWIDKIDPDKRFKWYLHGFSMGASTVLMMKDKAPKRFEAVIADAPWIDFNYLLKQEFYKRTGLPSIFMPYVEYIANIFFGQSFKKVDNEKRVSRLCGKKVYYFFEDEDSIITKYQREKLKAICPTADITLFHGFGHVEAFKKDPAQYTDLLTDVTHYNEQSPL